MIAFRGAYIAGSFRKDIEGDVLTKIDPGNTDRVIGEWTSTEAAVQDAVDAASRAYDDWAWGKEERRFESLKALRQVFKVRRRELADMMSSEMGKPLQESLAEVDVAIAKIGVNLREAAKLLGSIQGATDKEYYNYHPRGIIAILGPFNFPLHLPSANWIPALAMGNTVIFKPSELTPFTGQLIAECFHEAGFPKGVFNLVQGGRSVGEALVSHPDIRGIIFVGSDETGHKILKRTQHDPNKICILEMGGKNAAIILEDANIAKAAEDCVVGAFSTSGQRCNATSRILLHESIAQDFIKIFVEKTLQWHIGYYQTEENQMGPLVSEGALKKFLRYQRRANREGARSLLKGEQRKREHPGYYVSPAIHRFEEHCPKKIKRGYQYDEIFGPDVAIYSFDRLEEAIQIHNDCRYGLVASVFTSRKASFNAISRHLEVGNLHWNRSTIGPSPMLPFGGIKASGNGFPAGVLSPYYCGYPVAVKM